MKGTRKLFFCAAGCLCMQLLWPSCAQAYIDPGTGSFFFQMLAGIILGALFALKMSWARIRVFVRSLFKKEGR